MTMRYHPEIDGLRALAVLPVILFHANFVTFKGGYVGVDVFFVISGYLITTIIYGEIQEGSFSIVRFYERRIRRILPALFVVCLAFVPFAWLWLMPDEYKEFSRGLIAVTIFASNILFWSETGYFDGAAELKPLLHTWSLAVEEQFYVFFPLFLLLFRKLTQNALLALLVVLAAVSLGLAEWGSKTYPSANFYLLPTRMWELGVGAILAVSANTWSRTEGWLTHVASSVGLGMIIYAIFAFDETVPFPSLWGLIPVLGTALVIAYAGRQTVVGRVLGWGPIVGIGLISYSAYLWHQPLFVFARFRMLNEVTPLIYLGLSVLTLVLAYLSWRFVEQPFRNKTAFTRGQIFSIATVVSAGVIAFGMVGQFSYGIPSRIPPAAAQIAAWANKEDLSVKGCTFTRKKDFDQNVACRYGDFARSVFIWGDSHAWALTVGLKDVLNKNSTNLVQYTNANCVPVLEYRWVGKNWNCWQQNDLVFNALLNDKTAEIVVLAGRWSYFFEHTRFNNTEGGKEIRNPSFPSFNLDAPPQNPTEYTAVTGERVRATVTKLIQSGKKVVLVYPVPEVGWDVPKYLAREILFGIERQEPLSTNFAVFEERTRNSYAQLDLLEDQLALIRIKPEEVFCNTDLPDRCIAQLDGKPLYFDDNHLNGIGATMLSKKIVAAMKERGWIKRTGVQIVRKTGHHREPR